MQEKKKILIDYKEGGVAVITLDNPPLNLTTVAILHELLDAVLHVSGDDNVRVVIMTTAGERIFSGGSDMKEFPSIRDKMVETKLRLENVIFLRMETMPKPVIAAVGSQALGGGCELALACDFIILDERASMGMPEINIGTFPGTGGLFRLPRRVGQARAMEMLCLGSKVNAREALEIGLINQIAPAGKVMETAYAFALELAAKPKHSLACIKKGVYESYRQSTPEAMELSMAMTEKIMLTPDSIEGTKAFFEKRTPVFEGAFVKQHQ